MTVALEVGADHLTMLDVSPPDLGSVARETEVVKKTPLGIKDGDPPPLAADNSMRVGQSATPSTAPARRPRWFGKPAQEASGQSPASGCSCTSACWRRGSGPDGNRTRRRWKLPSPERLASRFRAGI